MRVVVQMLMRMRMSTKGVKIRVSMFVRSIGRVYMIVAMLSLIHNSRLERFVRRTTTPADGER